MALRSFASLLSLLLITLTIPFACAQNNPLGLRLETGETYRQTTESRVTINQEINGQSMKMVMGIDGIMLFRVEKIVDGEYYLDARFESLYMSTETPQGKAEFSSESASEQDLMSGLLASMKERSFEVVMSRTGIVREVNEVEQLWEPAIQKLTMLTDGQKDQVRAQLMNAYGAKALKGNIEMVTAIYPEEDVKEGDSWTRITNLESGVSGKMNTEYTYQGIQADHLLITGISVFTTEDKDAMVQANGMPLKYDLTGSMKSEIKVDKNSGWIIEAVLTQDISGDAYIKDNPQLPGGMKIPMTINNVMTVTD